MNNSAYETHTAQDIFIGGDFILKEAKRVIEAKSHVMVHFYTEHQSEAPLRPKSFYTICSKARQNAEATMMNLFVFGKKEYDSNHLDYPNKRKRTAVNDSLLSDPFKSKPVHIVDSNDLNPDEQYSLLLPLIKKRATKGINPIVLDLFHNSTIAKEYNWVIMLWKIMHAIFILISSVLLVYLTNLIRGVQEKDYLYLFIGIVLVVNNYVANAVSLYYIHNDMAYKACECCFNYALIAGIVLSAIELNVIPGTIPDNFIDYLNKNTYYKLIHHLLIVCTAALLLFNFKMKQFFNDYYDRLPVKLSLIPDKNKEEQAETDTGGYGYLNNTNE